MQFSTMQTELSDRLAAYDAAVAADLTKIKRWLNMGVQYICGKKLWPFMMAEEIVQTVTDVTTGTVSIAAGSANLTFSSAPTDSVNDRYIKLSTSQDWYQISSHTAGVTAATIKPPYVGSTNLVAGTYTVRKLLYSTVTPLIQVLDMKQLITPIRLISQSPRETDFFLPLYYSAGMPYYYIMSSPSALGAIQFSFLQSPDSVMNIMVRGIKTLADMSADSDQPLIPAPWHDAVINVGAFYGFQSLDDTRAATELQVAESRVADMAKVYSQDLGRQRIMQPVDGDSNFGLQWSLPSDFGPSWP